MHEPFLFQCLPLIQGIPKMYLLRKGCNHLQKDENQVPLNMIRSRLCKVEKEEGQVQNPGGHHMW